MALTLKVDDKFKAFMQSGSLPEVSSTDNGQVLTVVEGAWAKAAPSGGGGGSVAPLILEIDQSTATESGSYLNHSYKDVEDAVLSGRNVYFHVLNVENEVVTMENYSPVTEISGEYDTHDHVTNYYVTFANGETVCTQTGTKTEMLYLS